MVNEDELKMFLDEAVVMGYDRSDFQVAGNDACNEVRVRRRSTGKETRFMAERGARWWTDAADLLEEGFFGSK